MASSTKSLPAIRPWLDRDWLREQLGAVRGVPGSELVVTDAGDVLEQATRARAGGSRLGVDVRPAGKDGLAPREERRRQAPLAVMGSYVPHVAPASRAEVADAVAPGEGVGRQPFEPRGRHELRGNARGYRGVEDARRPVRPATDATVADVAVQRKQRRGHGQGEVEVLALALRCQDGILSTRLRHCFVVPKLRSLRFGRRGWRGESNAI